MESFRTRHLIFSLRGFTLVELLVTMSILGIITVIAVTGQSTFNQTLLLNDTSYTVALSAREAQSLGLSSRKFRNFQNGGYGLHFTNANPTKSYIVFADVSKAALQPSWCPIIATSSPEAKAGNCIYDDSSETFQTYDMTRGFVISDFCGKNGGGALTCASVGGIQSLDVLYLRPNTTAIITGITDNTTLQFTCAQITIKSPTGGTIQTIRMSGLGEVSVAQTCP